MTTEKAGWLKDEYLFLIGQYEAFDGKALTIKSWSSPLLGGGLALAIDKRSVGIALATMLVAACLWILEAIWKNFQSCYRDRIELLESWLTATLWMRRYHSRFMRHGRLRCGGSREIHSSS